MASRIGLTGRLILVGRAPLATAYSRLSKVMRKTGIERQIRYKFFYEKPTWKRKRKNYEKCVRVYNRGMKQNIDFVMRQSDPLPTTAAIFALQPKKPKEPSNF